MQKRKDGKRLVRITDCEERCFAELDTGCNVLTTECAGHDCNFYKPASCEDWIRVERNGEAWIVPPEEYYEM